MNHLIIRADAGGTLGTGHVMRMIALAQAYGELGGHATIVCARCPDPILEKVKELGIGISLLSSCELGSDLDVKLTLDYCLEQNASALVLDGYHFDENYLSQLNAADNGLKVMVVDDYGHCDFWDCDYVLNQNLGSEKNSYETAPHTELLLGADYALLRSDIRSTLTEAKEKEAPYSKLILTMGGADVDNVTSTMLELLEKADTDLEIKVLVGGANPHKSCIEKLVSESKHKIEILENVTDMPSLYLWADSIISAGGSTCWEWLAYGLHGAVVTIADNQEPVVAELQNANLALVLGWPHEAEVRNWENAISDWLQLDNLSGFEINRSVIDGYGANRAASKLMPQELWCRPATMQDAKLYFDWANDALVRKSGFSTDAIVWDDHCAWMERKISDPESQMYLFFQDRSPVGQVRFTQESGEYSGYLEIGISISSDFRGQQLGKPIVHLAQQELISKELMQEGIIARVKFDNSASANLFLNLGYTEQATDESLKCRVFKLNKNDETYNN